MAPDTTRLLITNLYADHNITVRLPSPYNAKTFEVLLLSLHKITLHTNSEVFRFLAHPPCKKLTVGGNYRSIGRSLTIEAYDSFWRIVHTSIPDQNIIFEE